MITCHVCGSKEIKFYKQKRVDGVYVVTARCKNDHIPEKGKPFYSKHGHNMDLLPPLVRDTEQEQLDFLKSQEKEVREILPKKLVPYKNYPLPIEDNPL